jgi:hypothetical protein
VGGYEYAKEPSSSPRLADFFSIIFIIGFYIVASMLVLHFFGEKAVAILDGADMAYEDRRGDKDLMYRITIGYHFDANGKEYHNSVVYRIISRISSSRQSPCIRLVKSRNFGSRFNL